MADREKVIKALRACYSADVKWCQARVKGQCDYNVAYCRMALFKDAAELLEAQEPRVLREGEVCDNRRRGTPMWLERHGTQEEHSGLWVFPISFNHWCDVMIFIPSSGEKQLVLSVFKYGKEWRCWTSRPTDAQKDAIAFFEMDQPYRTPNVLPARARLMTLDEACASDYVWYEQRNTGIQPSSVSRVPHKPGTYRVLRLGNIDAWEGADEYGIYWRCWTARPTGIQREATPWS